MTTNNKMDINSASLEDVANLPFMNKERARLVTDYIASNGPLDKIEQVDNIPGIGEKLSNLLEQHFTVGGGNSNRGGNNRNSDNNASNNR